MIDKGTRVVIVPRQHSRHRADPLGPYIGLEVEVRERRVDTVFVKIEDVIVGADVSRFMATD